MECSLANKLGSTVRRLSRALIVCCLVGICGVPGAKALAGGLSAGEIAHQRGAMHTSAVNDIAPTATVPVYTIVGSVNPSSRTLTATQTVRYTNRTTSTLATLGIRLFANLTDVGGSTTIRTLTIDGKSVAPTYGPQRYFVTIPLSTGILPGKSVTIQLAFTTIAPTNADTDLFGTLVSDGTTLAMPYAYPMLGMLRNGVWDAAIPDSTGDIVTSEVALFDVTLSGPSKGYTFVSTGTTIRTTVTGITQTVRIASGLQRDFAFALTKLMKKSQTVAGTTINVYGPASRASATTAALAAAVAAVPIFNTRIGQYPYNELDIISIDAGSFWGIEFPGFVLIEQLQYTTSADFEHLIVHEVGHQWFYNVIGNDVQRDAFVDEGLTNYTELLYDEARKRPTAAANTITYWRDDVASLRAAGQDAAVDQPISAMSDDQYSTLSYSKTALYIHAVRQRIGEAAFGAALKSYYSTKKYQVVDGTAFRNVAAVACKCSLHTLYTTWILQK